MNAPRCVGSDARAQDRAIIVSLSSIGSTFVSQPARARYAAAATDASQAAGQHSGGEGNDCGFSPGDLLHVLSRSDLCPLRGFVGAALEKGQP